MKKTFIFTCLCILFSFFACKNTADVDKPVLLDCLKTPLADFDLPNNATVYANTSGYLFSNTSVNFETVKWDFGDKTPISTAVNPEHIFTALGDYNVSLTVINCKNDSVKVSKKITVKNSIEFEKIVPNSQNAYFSTLLSINEDKFIIQGIGWSGYGLQLPTFAFGVKSIYTKIWESSVSTFKFNDDKSGTFRKDIIGDNLSTFCHNRIDDVCPSSYYTLIKMDTNGKLVFENQVSLRSQGCVSTPSGEYLLYGAAADEKKQDYPMSVSLIDAQGNIKWEEKYFGTADEYSVAESAFFDIKGNIVILGYRWKYINGEYNSKEFIAVLDKNGKLLEEKILDKVNAGNQSRSLQALDGSNFLLINTDTDEKTKKIRTTHLTKLNDKFEVVWQKTLDDEPLFADYKTQFMMLDKNKNNIYVVSNKINKKEFSIKKINTSGNVEWEKTFTKTFSIENIIETAKGELVLCGNFSNQLTSGNTIYLLKIDATGQIIWEKEIKSQYETHINAILEAKENEYLLGGEGFGKNDKGLLVIKVNGL